MNGMEQLGTAAALVAEALRRGARYTSNDLDAAHMELAQDWLRVQPPAAEFIERHQRILQDHGALTSKQAAAVLNWIVGLAEPRTDWERTRLGAWRSRAQRAEGLEQRERPRAGACLVCGEPARAGRETCSARCERRTRHFGDVAS